MSAPNLKEIEWAISELENEESSKSSYILLSALYTCRDHMREDTSDGPHISAYSESAAPINEKLDLYGDSEFLQTVSGKNPEDAWLVMDELMETLRVVKSNVYDSVMRKLNIL